MEISEAMQIIKRLKDQGMQVPVELTPELIAWVQDLIAQTEATGQGRITAWESIAAELEKKSLAWIQQVPAEWVGVHQANRGGVGVGGSESQVHGDQMLSGGFSFKKCSDATAFQCPPPPWDTEAQEFNDKQSRMSQGLIPELVKLVLLSVGSTHTNTFVRQAKAGVKCVVQGRSDEHGNLNAELLARGREQFKEALDKGLRWFTMHWICPFVWPQLPDLAQNCLNTEARGQQSEIEIMLAMHKQMESYLQAGLAVDWGDIEAKAKASLPPCASYIGALSTYVKLNSGGQSAELLHELVKFSKTFACSEKGPLRTLGGEFLMKVATLSFGPLEKYPLVKNALLEANLQTDKVVDGICKMITPTMVSQLAKQGNRATVKKCEALMEQARGICKTGNLT